MPSSRSAKEICREFGESDIACKVAKKRERRRREREKREREGEKKPPAQTKPPVKKPPPKKETPGERRTRKIREIVEGAQTGEPPS